MNCDKYLLDRNFILSDDVKDKFEEITNLTLSTNEKFNLTAIKDKDVFFEKMIVDSLLGLIGLDLNKKKVIDVGTGGGFPGLVISTMFPNADLTLFDATKKKIDYLTDAKKILNLNYVTYCGRAEEYSLVNPNFYDYAFARALAPLNILLEIIIPMVKIGGVLVAYKGSNALDEIKQCESAIKKLNCRIVKIYEDLLPVSSEKRLIIYIQKEGPTPKQYPRKWAEIKRKPL